MQLRIIHFYISDLTQPEKKASDDNIGLDIKEIELYGPSLDKKWIGDIFGGGYGYHKRDPYVDKGLEIARMFAEQNSGDDSSLDIGEGSGAMGKFSQKSEQYDEEKGQFNAADFTRQEVNRGEELKDYEAKSGNLEADLALMEPTEQKRLFGWRLGNGFALGKRSKRSLPEEYLSGDEEPETLFENNAFGPDDVPDNEMVYYYPAKRYFHSDPGQRFAFGKRSNWKRYFGHVLGSGFRLGKRNDELENNKEGIAGDVKMIFPRPIETFPGVEQPMEPEYYPADGYQLDKRFGYVLGRGFRFGKRPAKRYGWVLGRGFFLRKRNPDFDDSVENMLQNLNPDDEIQNRFGFSEDPHNTKRFGFLLGHGMHFGKRQDGQYSDHYETPYKREYRFSHYKRRPFGHVLGNGFAFGKRTMDDTYTSGGDGDSYDSELMNAEKRAFGHWLGHGFKFGKRSQEYPDGEYDTWKH